MRVVRQASVYKRHYLLNSSVDRVLCIMGSAALVLGSILVAVLVCFASVASVQIALVRFKFM